MSCRHCTSNNQSEFRAEMSVVHRKFKDLRKTPVLMWSDVRACFDCGFTEFTLGQKNCNSSLVLKSLPEFSPQLPIDAPDFLYLP